MFEFCKQLLIVGFSLALVGCGGGGGGGGDGGSSATPPINVNAGVFKGTVNGSDIWTVLASETVVTDPTTPNWFSYQFNTVNSTTTLDLYSARVTGVGSGQATGSAIKHFQGLDTPLTGNLSLAMAQSTRLTNQLSFQSNLTWSSDALPSTQYDPSLTPVTLNGSWTGNWYFQANVNPNITLNLAGGSLAGQSAFTNCNFHVGSLLTPSVNGGNVHLTTLKIDPGTGCSLNTSNPPQVVTYQGLAFVLNNPRPGSASELVIMAVSSDHKALFFQGYR